MARKTAAPTIDDCAAGLLEMIPAVMRTIRARMRQEAAVELTVVQFRTLARASRSGGGGASVSDVAEHVGLTLPSASKLVQGLVDRGYLRRQNDPRDRRVSILLPTPKGRRAMDIARRAAREELGTMLQSLSRRERTRLADALDSLRPLFLDAGKAGKSNGRSH
jgi:DNA-binding MarR family transcriptional regulator